MLQTTVIAHWTDHDKAQEVLTYLDAAYGHMTEIIFENRLDGDAPWVEFNLRASYSEEIAAEDIILLYLRALKDSGVTFSWTNIHQGNKVYYTLSPENVDEFKYDAAILSQWRDIYIYGLL